MVTYRIFGTALLELLFSSSAREQQGNSIRGKVRNSSGANMSQVVVSIETGNGSPFGQTATNNEGDFFFGGLTETSYVLVISAPDYNPASEHVDFVNRTGPDSPGETRTIFITLTPKSGSRSANGAIFFQNVPKAAQDQFELAAAVFAEAARLNPLNPDYPLMRGKALISHAGSIDPSQPKNKSARTDALTEAETSIKKAYELSGKKLAMAHLLLASVYEKR